MHICISNLTTNGSDNGLSPGRRHAISEPMRGYFNWILIKFQTFSFKKMHMCCMQIASINQGIKSQWQHLGRHWFSYWLSPAWENVWYRDKSESCFPYHSWIPESLIFTLDADGYCRRSLRPSVRPSVHPERRYHSNALRISTISLKFGRMIHSTMKETAI